MNEHSAENGAPSPRRGHTTDDPEAWARYAAEKDVCQAVCWMSEYDRDALCSLDEDHDGPHIDMDEGWEW